MTATEINTGTVVVVYPPNCGIAMDFTTESYPGITKMILSLEDEKFKEKLKDKLSQYEYQVFKQLTYDRVMGLILILSHKTVVNSENCIFALQEAERKKRVLVWDTESPFPANSITEKLPENVRVCFSSIAVPLIQQYTPNCWKKVADKLFDRTKVNRRTIQILTPVQPSTKMNWFLSHRQLTGQRMAMSLYHELEKMGDSAFLDVKCEFDLHDLKTLVELCEYFVFIYSEGIFASEYCRLGT